jgi:sigma-B regulation protein RsbU (phosphoserine phosphatase)
MPKAMFISVFYGILDLETNVFTFCRAGHEPGLAIRARDGEVVSLCPAGMALGLDPGPLFDETLEEAAIALEPHDLLVLYTDGITETSDQEENEFGRDRLAALLQRERHRSLAEIHGEVHQALRHFAIDAPAADDRTLLLIRPRQNRTNGGGGA